MQASGTLSDQNLRGLLKEAQSERVTGKLVVSSGSSSGTIYFLFGHLFHAVDDRGRTGEQVVISMLDWNQGSFEFDPKAKLPADETVRTSIDEILSAPPGPTGPIAAAAAAPPPVTSPVSGPPMPPSPPLAPPAGTPPAAAPVGPPPVNSQASPASPVAPPSAPAPASPSAVPPTYAPPAPAAPAASVAPAAAPAAAPTTFNQAAAAPAPAFATERAPEAATETAIAHPARRAGSSQGVLARPTPPSGTEPIPVPDGEVLYDSLKTSFIDFGRLLTTLEAHRHTGYVRLITPTSAGLILHRDGVMLECVLDRGSGITLGYEALRGFRDEVVPGHGVIDVIALDGEIVDGLHLLAVAKPIYQNMYASWVNMPQLLANLNRRRISGSITVRSGVTGVILLRNGDVVGSYTTHNREILSTPEMVLSLCENPDAEIEVRSPNEAINPPLEIASIGATTAGQAQAALSSPPVSGPRPVAGGPAAGVSPAAPSRPEVQPVPAYVPPAPAPPAPTATSAPAVPAPPPAPVQAAPLAPIAPTTAPVNPTAPRPVSVSAAGSDLPDPAAPEPASATPVQPAPRAAASGPDWEKVVAELQATVNDALGNRARKVKELLDSAERSRAGLEAAINQIPSITLLFVDTARLEALSQQLKDQLNAYR